MAEISGTARPAWMPIMPIKRSRLIHSDITLQVAMAPDSSSGSRALDTPLFCGSVKRKATSPAPSRATANTRPISEKR